MKTLIFFKEYIKNRLKQILNTMLNMYFKF